MLSADWRVLGFGAALICGVTLLFGFLPALRASAVRPISALKGGDEPHGRQRLMHGLIALQVTFCFVVLFVTGLFVTTLHRLSAQPTGFSAAGLLLLDTAAQQPQSPIVWQQVADRLRTTSGVEAAAVSQWPLMSGTMSNNFISIDHAPPGNVLAFFLGVSPGWLDVMKIPLIAGRNFRTSDVNPRVAIVNQAFAKQFFSGEDPIGKSFGAGQMQYEVVGVAGDAIYRNIREPILPQVYRPFSTLAADGKLEPMGNATFLVRTVSANPLALAPTLRRVVARTSTGLRVSNIRTQQEIIDAQTVRERLLAALAMFFACVALLLAAVGLYGVLNYSVVQRRREIGIRMAIGARHGAIAKLLTIDLLTMVAIGVAAGAVLGLTSARDRIPALRGKDKRSENVLLPDTGRSRYCIPSDVTGYFTRVSHRPGIYPAIGVDPEPGTTPTSRTCGGELPILRSRRGAGRPR